MKTSLKIIFSVIITAILCIGGTTYAAFKYHAKDVSFTSSNSDFTAANVEDALNFLYHHSNQANIDMNSIIDYINRGQIPIANGLVPILTSNTGSNGIAFCSTPIYQNSGIDYDAWKAFNGDLTGDDKKNWVSYVLEGNYGYVGYQFHEKKSANVFYVNMLKSDKNFGVCMTHFILQASNDGENWVDLTEEITHPAQTSKYYAITKNQNSYFYYRLYGYSQGAYSLVAIHELQLFSI